MNCKKCGNPINLHIFGMPDNICFGCYDNKNKLVENNMENFSDILLKKARKKQKAKTQPMGCPCCEAPAEVKSKITNFTSYRVECKFCKISTSHFVLKETAIEIWNTRPNHNKVFRTFPV